ncbi:MAG: efflux RND transporter periplasmic adaptor subunit [Burkholderiales bacterium]|nr:efflux RND transporter periplasmic adaptor subunit [Burkholderiales bacterium]
MPGGAVRRPFMRASVLWATAALLLAACEKAPPPEEPVRAVKLVTVGESAYQSGHEYAGEVRARVESRLGFRVAGKIVRRAVEPGQRVQAGQLLAQLDARDYQLAADAARAQVNAATRAAQATLDQARAQLSSQGNQAGYTQLLADVSGVVTGVDAEAGQVVAAGTPVVRIAQDGPRDVVFAVPEDRVAAVRVGQPMLVRAWASDAQWSGSVREVAASADPVTRTYAVKVALAGNAPPLGATVTVTPQHSGAQGQPVIKLPTSALWQQGQGSAVWVYDAASGTVRAQAVQVAGADGNEAVIAAGLTPGMRVVATGAHVLSPGQKVTVYQPKTGSAPAQPAPAAIHNAASEPGAPAVAASR